MVTDAAHDKVRPTRAEIKTPVDDWFENSGVPHFIHRYSAAKRLPELSIVLCVVLAFELAVAPWLEFGAVQLILAPLVLFVLTLCARPLLLIVFDVEGRTQAGGVSLFFRGALLGLASGYLIGTLTVPTWDAWVNFAVLLATFAAATVVFSRTLWIGEDAAVRQIRGRLLVLLLLALFIFTVEGSVTDPVNEAVGLDTVPQGLPALVCVVLMLGLAIRLAHTCRGVEATTEPTRPAAAFQLAAVPALLLVYGGETAVLPHTADEGWAQASIPIALILTCLLVAGAVAGVLARGASGATATAGRLSPPAAVVALCVLAFMFAIGYPVLVGLFFTVDAFGTKLTGTDAFWVTFAINAVCIGIGWLAVSLGLDRIAVWGTRAAWSSKWTAVAGMARGLPLLLVFLAFFVMQAELWEVVVEIGTREYVVLVALMLVLAVAFGYAAAHKEVGRRSIFKSWREVQKAALPDRAPLDDPPPPDPFPMVMKELASEPGKPCKPELSRFKYFNAVLVMAVYQTVILLPVTLAATALFWVLGRIAVPPKVAGEWVYGDGTPPARGEALAERVFLEQPWTRVALVLGAFSALYLAVHVLSTQDQRRDFFEGADSSLRQRLAVRVAYMRLVPPDPVADRSRLAGLKLSLGRRRGTEAAQ
jgi:hypothetical protein